MSLRNYTITPQDLAGVGVIGLADTPGLSAADMQAKLEETARQLIVPRFNAALTEADAQLAQTPTTARVQQMIDDQVTDIGAGDMAAVVYDPWGEARNIFALANIGTRGMVTLSDEPSILDTAVTGVAATPAAVAAVKAVADAAMPLAGGAFTGPVAAGSEPRTGVQLRNTLVLESDLSTPVHSSCIVFVRQ